MKPPFTFIQIAGYYSLLLNVKSSQIIKATLIDSYLIILETVNYFQLEKSCFLNKAGVIVSI